jgi:hypothetical protein
VPTTQLSHEIEAGHLRVQRSCSLRPQVGMEGVWLGGDRAAEASGMRLPPRSRVRGYEFLLGMYRWLLRMRRRGGPREGASTRGRALRVTKARVVCRGEEWARRRRVR